MRGFDVELMEHLKTRIAEVVNGVAATYRTPATIETLSDVPPLVLDDGMTQASLGYVGAVLPKAAFLPLFHAMASEDFALISSEIPSAYFTVGAAVTDTDEHFAQHHPKARFNGCRAAARCRGLYRRRFGLYRRPQGVTNAPAT